MTENQSGSRLRVLGEATGEPYRTRRADPTNRRIRGERSRMACNDGPMFEPSILNESAGIWAAPGLIIEPSRPELDPVAVLTCLIPLGVRSNDYRPGAESVNLVTSTLLAEGFALVTLLDPTALIELPFLADWSVDLDGELLESAESDNLIDDSGLGLGTPLNWRQALQRRGHLVLLMASHPDPGRIANPAAAVDTARREGNMVGAQVSVYQ